MGDSGDVSTNYVLLKRGKRHDYFTSCLPWPQKGAAVPLPLTGNAPVTGIYSTGANATIGSTWYDSSGVSHSTPYGWNGTGIMVADAINSVGTSGTSGHKPGVFADLSAVTATTINQLRQAFQIQRMYERDARGGTRYTEIVRSHFGVISPDARLQRPGIGRAVLRRSTLIYCSDYSSAFFGYGYPSR